MGQPNNRNEDMFKTLFEIQTKDYPKEIIGFMKERNIPFKAWKIHDFKQDQQEIDEELPLVEVDLEIYQKLKKLSEITRIPIVEIVSKELGDFFYSVGDIPVIFLDRHLGIENIEKPIKMLKNLKALLHISERYLESLKTKEDLLKEIEEWNHPLKNIKK